MVALPGRLTSSVVTVFAALRSSPAGRALLGLALALGLAVLTGCQADLAVKTTVENDGSGVVVAEVVLDDEAASGLMELDPESDGLPLRDLFSAGWEVGSPTPTDEGTVITASKRFGTPDQFGEVMAELSSEDGLFRNFKLSRNQSFGRLDYSVDGDIVTSDGFDTFADEALTEALGSDLATVAEFYQADPSQVTVRAEVTLPGELQEDASIGQVTVPEPGVVVGRWQTTLAGPGQVDVVLNTTRRSITAQVIRGLAVVAGVLAALLLFGRLVRWAGGRARRKPPAPKVRPADAHGRRPGEVAATAAGRAAAVTGEVRPAGNNSGPAGAHGPNAGASSSEENGRRELPYRVVALDGMGVLYKEGDDIRNLLIPFARSVGSIVPDEEITAKARLVSLGRMTSSDFWISIGVPGDSNQLDAAYLATHQLTPGVVKYLRSLRDRGIKAACITNDGTRWATKLRATHSLENLIDPWVVSGSVGVRKPDPPIFEVLRRVAGEPAEAILVVDDNLDTLDAARNLGFLTAWFAPQGRSDEARGHDIWRRFDIDDGEPLVPDSAAGKQP